MVEYRDAWQVAVDLGLLRPFPRQVDVADRQVVVPRHEQFSPAGALSVQSVGEVLVVAECGGEEFEIVRARRPDREATHRPGEPSFLCHEALWWRSSLIHHRTFGARPTWVVNR